jgi:hypothetical protein
MLVNEFAQSVKRRSIHSLLKLIVLYRLVALAYLRLKNLRVSRREFTIKIFSLQFLLLG